MFQMEQKMFANENDSICGHVRLSMAFFDIFFVLYGLFEDFHVFYGNISSFLTVIDPNSFDLVFHFNQAFFFRPFF